MKLHRPQLLGLISLAALTLVVPIAAVALTQASSDVSTPAATAAVPLSAAPIAQSAPEPKLPPPVADAPVPPAPVAANPPAEVPAAAAAPPPQQRLTQAELDQLVAPIALYPDQLLTQVLMASTYPVEVVAAARWIRDPANRGLRGDALMRALRERNWDPSVMALVPFPRLLKLLCDRIEWTQSLGNAFIAQQADIMDAVQRLRQQALAAGNLKSGRQCQCVVESRESVITIGPARPTRVYVPVYDPVYVYGSWPYPLYPPVVFPLPIGFAFAPGFFIGYTTAVNVAFYGPLWGWGWFDWAGHGVLVDNGRIGWITGGVAAGFAGGAWAHNPGRGGGIAGASSAVAARSGATAGTSAARMSAARGGAASVHGRAAWRGGASRGSVAGYRGGGHAAHFASRGFGGHRGAAGGAPGGFHGRGGMHFAAAGGAHGGGGHGHR